MRRDGRCNHRIDFQREIRFGRHLRRDLAQGHSGAPIGLQPRARLKGLYGGELVRGVRVRGPCPDKEPLLRTLELKLVYAPFALADQSRFLISDTGGEVGPEAWHLDRPIPVIKREFERARGTLYRVMDFERNQALLYERRDVFVTYGNLKNGGHRVSLIVLAAAALGLGIADGLVYPLRANIADLPFVHARRRVDRNRVVDRHVAADIAGRLRPWRACPLHLHQGHAYRARAHRRAA